MRGLPLSKPGGGAFKNNDNQVGPGIGDNPRMQKIINDQKKLLDQDLKVSFDQIDKNFELKKVLISHTSRLFNVAFPIS